MKARILRVGLGIILAVLSGEVAAQGVGRRPKAGEDLPPLVRQAVRAQSQLKFSGERIVEFKAGAERRRHRELILRDGDRLRIEFPDDSPFRGQVIVEDGRVRNHFFPDRNEIRVLPARRDETLQRMLRLRGRHGGKPSFVTGAPETVAGLRAETISVQDQNGNTYQKLWIHARSGLIVKRELYDRTGAVVGLFEYKNLNFRPAFRPGDFEIRRAGARVITPADEVRRLAAAHGLLAVFLPEDVGQLDSVRMLPLPGRKVLVQVYQTSQGPISLFQVSGSLNRELLRREGGRDFQAHTWSIREISLALVGSRPESELAALAARISER